MKSWRLTSRLEIYLEPLSFLLGFTVDDAVVCFMLGPVTFEYWHANDGRPELRRIA